MRGWRLAVATIALGCTLPSLALATTVDGAHIARLLGFNAAALDRVRGGELIARRSPETTDKELALVVWGWSRHPVALLFELLAAEDLLRVDPSVVAFGEIDPAALERSFEGLALGDASLAELGAAGPAGPLNLSHEEHRKLAEPRDRLVTYREVLAQRVRDYLRGGMGAIAPYARGRGVVEPGAELRAATAGYRVLSQQVPDFHRAWTRFPERASEWAFTHRFFWIVQRLEKRPTVVLTHVMLGSREGRAFAAERQFYVGRAYNASETVWGGLPAERGSYVFYHNRTSTDRVAGFGSSMRKALGRQLMENEVLAFLERLRAAFE